MSGAGAAVGLRVRLAGQRVRGGLWSIGQCAIASSVAWYFATTVLGHPRPFFACVAAVVCLGVRAAQRLRRVAELAVGVTLGVAVGDALVGVIGSGTWQIGFVVGIALLLALALDGGTLVTAQAGLQAVFVVALPRVQGGNVARWEDALVGGATALLIAALLPADPWGLAKRTGSTLLTELAGALRESAKALREQDPALAAYALAQARGTQRLQDTFTETLFTGRDISRLSPLRRDRDGTWLRLSQLSSGVDRATRNLRVLVRRVLFSVNTGEDLPAGLPAATDRLAEALDHLAVELNGPYDDVIDALVALADDLDPLVLGASGLSAAVVVGQLRSALVDLLEGVGVSPERARAVLPPLR